MPRPVEIDPSTVSLATDPFPFAYVREVGLRRPLYLGILAVLLIVLVTVASTYSARNQPIHQLFVGVGGLVLGVWGVRQILVPGYPPYVTAVDLALSLSILILLVGVILRGVLHVHRGGKPASRSGAASNAEPGEDDGH
jgi:hypothetical protein